MLKVELFLPFPCFYMPFFSFPGHEATRFTAIFVGNFRDFVNFPPFVLVPTVDALELIRKIGLSTLDGLEKHMQP